MRDIERDRDKQKKKKQKLPIKIFSLREREIKTGKINVTKFFFL